MGGKGNARDPRQSGELHLPRADELEEHQRRMEAKYIRAHEAEPRCEIYHTEDAEVLLVGYGIVSRVLLSTVEALRQEGVKAGLFRPITLWPYPSQALAKAAARWRKCWWSS